LEFLIDGNGLGLGLETRFAQVRMNDVFLTPSSVAGRAPLEQWFSGGLKLKSHF